MIRIMIMIRIRIMPPGDHRNHGNINCSWPISSSFRPAASQNKFKEFTNFITCDTQVLVCCRNHPTATGCQSKWAESQSDEQWKKNNKKAILPEPWRWNWQHQVPVLWDGGWTRWGQRLHLHPPLLRGGTGIIILLLIMPSKISSTISKCNYVLCWNQETQLLGGL